MASNALMYPCRVTLGNESWHFDESQMTTGDYRQIKQHVGMSRVEFVRGIANEDPDAMTALIWFLRNRQTAGLPYASVVFRMADVEFEVVEPDPTQAAPAAPTPSPTGTATSTSSTPSADSEASTSTP